MTKRERVKRYITSQYIDYGDLNEQAEKQIGKAYIDGFDSGGREVSLEYCVIRVSRVLASKVVNEAKKNENRIIAEVPEIMEIINALEVINKQCLGG